MRRLEDILIAWLRRLERMDYEPKDLAGLEFRGDEVLSIMADVVAACRKDERIVGAVVMPTSFARTLLRLSPSPPTSSWPAAPLRCRCYRRHTLCQSYSSSYPTQSGLAWSIVCHGQAETLQALQASSTA